MLLILKYSPLWVLLLDLLIINLIYEASYIDSILKALRPIRDNFYSRFFSSWNNGSTIIYFNIILNIITRNDCNIFRLNDLRNLSSTLVISVGLWAMLNISSFWSSCFIAFIIRLSSFTVVCRWFSINYSFIHKFSLFILQLPYSILAIQSTSLFKIIIITLKFKIVLTVGVFIKSGIAILYPKTFCIIGLVLYSWSSWYSALTINIFGILIRLQISFNNLILRCYNIISLWLKTSIGARCPSFD